MAQPVKKHLFAVARLLLIAAGVGYILWSVRWHDYAVAGPDDANPILRDGMLRLIAESKKGWLLAGLAMTGLIVPLQTLRWWLLLRCRKLDVAFGSVMRLTLTGLFFNFCVPLGSNGGDVAKAYGVAKSVHGQADNPENARTIAVISVLLDRLAGLLGLLLLAAAAGPFLIVQGNGAVGKRVTATAWAILGVLATGAFLYLHPLPRRLLGINLLTRVGVVQKLDAAVTGYRHHVGTFAVTIGLSVPVHLILATATAFAGYAVGVPAALSTLIAALPIAFLTGALPITVLGMGVMEPAAASLLEGSGTTFNQIVAMMMAYRAFMLVYGLIGGLAMLLRRKRRGA